MTHEEKLARLKVLLPQVALEPSLEAMAKKLPPLEMLGQEADAAAVGARAGLEKLAEGQDHRVSPAERQGLEAIILPKLRPVVFVRNGTYDALSHALWTHLNDRSVRERLDPLLPSIGRIELANSSLPYGGTGFVIGSRLVMTNRHVARLFADGVGSSRRVVYRSGDAAIDFKRERDTPEEDRTGIVQVRDVVMIHPYWDMALLRLEEGPVILPPLTLSVRPPEEFQDREVAAVGYPARDPRNDLAVQNRVFGGIYDVKRFQPGLARARRRVPSFGHEVNAMTHDSSTLGGNSGSAVIHIDSGEVIGLHFSGRYLDANFAVPAFELARDLRVVEAGVHFAQPRPCPVPDGSSARADREGPEHGPAVCDSRDVPKPVPGVEGATVTWTLPIQVSISLGTPMIVAPAADKLAAIRDE